MFWMSVREIGVQAAIIMQPLHPANTIETKWWQTIMKHQNFCESAFALSAKQSGSLVDKNGMQN